MHNQLGNMPGVPVDGVQIEAAIQALKRLSTRIDTGVTLPPDHPMVVAIRRSSQVAAERSETARICNHVRSQLHDGLLNDENE